MLPTGVVYAVDAVLGTVLLIAFCYAVIKMFGSVASRGREIQWHKRNRT